VSSGELHCSGESFLDLKVRPQPSLISISSHDSAVSGKTLFRRDDMPARKKGSRRKYGKGAAKMVQSAMRRTKRGTLRSGKGGKGGKVKSRKQAIAIGLSEARKKGAKVPRKRAA
jgi:hypothetical protein